MNKRLENCHRCVFCGRFFWSPLPDAYGCRDHIPEANERLRREIEQSNAKVSRSTGGRMSEHKVDAAETLAKTVACPTCDALPGMACWRSDGRSGPREWAHMFRYRLVSEPETLNDESHTARRTEQP